MAAKAQVVLSKIYRLCQFESLTDCRCLRASAICQYSARPLRFLIACSSEHRVHSSQSTTNSDSAPPFPSHLALEGSGETVYHLERETATASFTKSNASSDRPSPSSEPGLPHHHALRYHEQQSFQFDAPNPESCTATSSNSPVESMQTLLTYFKMDPFGSLPVQLNRADAEMVIDCKCFIATVQKPSETIKMILTHEDITELGQLFRGRPIIRDLYHRLSLTGPISFRAAVLMSAAMVMSLRYGTPDLGLKHVNRTISAIRHRINQLDGVLDVEVLVSIACIAQFHNYMSLADGNFHNSRQSAVQHWKGAMALLHRFGGPVCVPRALSNEILLMNW